MSYGVDLCESIKGVLSDYPVSSILKEFVQNADDAGATEVKFGVDRRSHASGSPSTLLYHANGQHQGPALMVYNNAIFTEDDIRSIRTVRASSKKEDVRKTGRFGIGFNAVYHVTDLPSFACQDYVCFFDPTYDIVPKGFQQVFSKDMPLHPQQFSPYDVFGCDVRHRAFDGTLFRLPFRSTAQASASKLSSNTFAPDDCERLFDLFKQQPPLLFLKNVRSVEFHSIGDNGASHLLHGISLAPPVPACRAFHTTLPDASATRDDRLASLSNLTSRADLLISETGEPPRRWRIRQSSGTGLASRISLDAQDGTPYRLKLLPWGGVAVPEAPVEGRAYCFLPMPITTGLPVHVNGYFELPSDRRGILWDSDDIGEAQFRTQWNRTLLEDVIATEYTRALLEVLSEAKASFPPDPAALQRFYSLIPATSIPMPWCLLSAEVASRLSTEECIWCGEASGWTRPSACHAAGDSLSEGVTFALRQAGLCVAEALPGVAAASLGVAALTPESAYPSLASAALRSRGVSLTTVVSAELLCFLLTDEPLVEKTRLSDTSLFPILSGRARGSLPPHSPLYWSDSRTASQLWEDTPGAEDVIAWVLLEGTPGADALRSPTLRKALGILDLGAQAMVSLLLRTTAPGMRQPGVSFLTRFWEVICGMPMAPGTLAPLEGRGVLPTRFGPAPLPPSGPSPTAVVATGTDLDAVLFTLGIPPAITPRPIEGYVARSSDPTSLLCLLTGAMGDGFAGNLGIPETDALRNWVVANQSSFGEGCLAYAGCLPIWSAHDTASAEALLRFANGNLWELCQGDPAGFFTRLSQFPWLPVLQAPLEPLAPFAAPHSALVSASECRPQSDYWLCGGCFPILALPCSDAFAQGMGWGGAPDPDLLAEQLSLVATVASQGKGRQLGYSEVTVLSREVPRLYDALMQWGAQQGDPQAARRLGDALQRLRSRPVVWMGDRFVLPSSIAGSPRQPCALLGLHALPGALVPYGDLFRHLGMEADFTGVSYSAALGALMEQRGGAPLATREVSEICAVLLQLVSSQTPASPPLPVIPVPDADGVLRQPSQVYYDDMGDWDAGGDSLVGQGERMPSFAVHPSLSQRVSDELGVRSGRMLLAEGCATGFFDDAASGVAEAFGQHESITTRIKNIIAEYVEDTGIFNELLQNADDAGARSFSIMLDKTDYGTTSLFSGQLAEWQGPAFVVHNDGVFREQDFQNLAAVGKGAKLQDSGKTGKFGIGFNSVYHFTDIPSFMSGESLVILDPHRAYLKGTTSHSPGLRMKIPSPQLNRFSDQLEPYKLGIFGSDCIGSSKYEGTLFRFPLRNDTTASQSEIRGTKYSTKQAMELLWKFIDTSGDLLLFLKHIREVRVVVRENGEDSTLFRASMDVKTIQGSSQEDIYRFIAGPSGGDETRHAFKQRLSQAKKLPHGLSEATITQIRKGLREETRWLISSTVAGGKAKDMAVRSERKLIPWAGVAMLVERQAKQSREMVQWPRDLKGRVYAFLPLPQHTSMPLHLNGAFELSSNRRNLWFDDFDKVNERTQWNTNLITEGCVPALAELLDYLKGVMNQYEQGTKLYSNVKYAYYSLFPEVQQKGFLEAFFRGVRFHLREKEVLDGGSRWVKPTEALYADFRDNDEFYPHRGVITAALRAAGKQIVDPPVHVIRLFTDGRQQKVTAESVCDAFRGNYAATHELSDADLLILLRFAYLGQKTRNPMYLDRLPFVKTKKAWKMFVKNPTSATYVHYVSQNMYGLVTPENEHLVLDPEYVGTYKDLNLLNRLNIVQDSGKAFPALVEAVLPPGYGKAITTTQPPGSVQWMQAFWVAAAKSPAAATSLAKSYPLVPGSKLMWKLDAAAAKLPWLSDGMQEKTKRLIHTLGIEVLDMGMIPKETSEKVYGTVLKGLRPMTPARLMSIIALDTDIQNCVRSTPELRLPLFDYLFGQKGDRSYTKEQARVIASLPIFRTHGKGEEEWAELTPNRRIVSTDHDGILDGSYYRIPRDAHSKVLTLAHAAGVQVKAYTEGRFVSQCLIPLLYDDARFDEKDEASQKLLRTSVMDIDLENYDADQQELLDALRRCSWLQNREGKKCKPSDLLDAAHPCLNGLKQTPTYQAVTLRPNDWATNRMDVLSELGLHTEFTWMAARVVMQKAAELQDGKAVQLLLQATAWLPVPEDQSPSGVAHFNFCNAKAIPAVQDPQIAFNSALANPDALMKQYRNPEWYSLQEVQPASQAPLYSAEHPIALWDIPQTHVTPPPFESALRQLVWIATEAEATASQKMDALKLLYGSINRRLNAAPSWSPAVEEEDLASKLWECDAPIVHVGDGVFAQLGCVARKFEPRLGGRMSWLGKLFVLSEVRTQQFHTEYPYLARAFELRDRFTPSDYSQALLAFIKSKGRTQCTEEELEEYVEVVEHLVEEGEVDDITHLPNTQGFLRPRQNLVQGSVGSRQETAVHAGFEEATLASLGLRTGHLHLLDLCRKGYLQTPHAVSVTELPAEAVLHAMINTAVRMGAEGLELDTTFAFGDSSDGFEQPDVFPGTEDYIGSEALAASLLFPGGTKEDDVVQQAKNLMSSSTALLACFALSDYVQIYVGDTLLVYHAADTCMEVRVPELNTSFPDHHLQRWAGRAQQGLCATVMMCLRRAPAVGLGREYTNSDMQAAAGSLRARLPGLLALTPLSAVTITTGYVTERLRCTPPPGQVDPRQAPWWDAPVQGKQISEQQHFYSVEVSGETTGEGLAASAFNRKFACCLVTGGVPHDLPQKLDVGPAIAGAACYAFRVGEVPGTADAIAQMAEDAAVHFHTAQLCKTIPEVPATLLSSKITDPNTGTKKQRSEWNSHADTKLLKAYVSLLVYLTEDESVASGFRKSGHGSCGLEDVYHFWPKPDRLTEHPFKDFYGHIVAKRVFLVNGEFCFKTNACFGYAEGVKLSRSAARMLGETGVNVFDVPAYVAEGVCRNPTGFGESVTRTITPSLVREAFLAYDDDDEESSLMPPVVKCLKPCEAVELLDVAVQDLRHLNPVGAAEVLDGVCLLPKLGGVGMIDLLTEADEEEEEVFVGGPSWGTLLPPLRPYFLHPGVLSPERPALQRLFTNIAFLESLGLTEANPDMLFRNMMHTPVPPSIRFQQTASASVRSSVTDKWLEAFWSLIIIDHKVSASAAHRDRFYNVMKFVTYPLLPLEDGRLASVRILRGAFVFAPEGVARVRCDPPGVRDIARTLQLPVVDERFSHVFGPCFDSERAEEGLYDSIYPADRLVRKFQFHIFDRQMALPWHLCSPQLRDRLLREMICVSPHSACVLQALPLFKPLKTTETDERIRIDQHAEVRFAPAGNPFFSPKWPDAGVYWIAKPEGDPRAVEQLLQRMKLRSLSSSDVWVQCVLPSMAHISMAGSERMARLEYIRNNNVDDTVFKSLRRLPVFPTRQGKLHMPIELVRPDSDMAAVLGSSAAILDQPYCDPKWANFLHRLGMKAQYDVGLYSKCAKEIARTWDARKQAATGLDKDLERRAALLLKEFRPEFATPDLGGVVFIPAFNERTGRQELFSMRGCCRPAENHLVLATRAALPDKWGISLQSARVMGLESPPSTAAMAESLKLADKDFYAAYTRRNPSFDTVATFARILGALGKKMSNFEDPFMVPLQFRKCVPITQTTFACPATIFTKPPAVRPPFAYRVPSAYSGSNLMVLQCLGVKETPSVADYQRIIQHAAEEYQWRDLPPTELNSFLGILETVAGAVQGGVGVVSHVPDLDSRLVSVSRALVNDTPWLLPRIRKGELSFGHPRMSEALCDRIGMQRLSRAVTEELVSRTVLATEDSTLRQLHESLRSPQFLDCLTTILEHNGSAAPDTVVAAQRLGRLEVVVCSRLQTRLKVSTRDITAPGDTATSYFLDTEKLTLYVLKSNRVTVHGSVARSLTELLRLPQIVPFVGDLLQCRPHEMHSTLQDLKVAGTASDSIARGVGGRPLVGGERVSEQPIGSAARNLVTGECVVYVDETGVKRYAQFNRAEGDVCRLTAGVRQRTVPSSKVYTFDLSGEATPSPQANSNIQLPTAAPEPTASAEHRLGSLMQELAIPLGAEQANLLERLDSLHAELTKERHRRTQLEKEKQMAENERDSLKNQSLCTICMERSFDTTLPCGHVLCRPCGELLVRERSGCHMCRRGLTEASLVKIYVS